jgi:selenocysteine lyase/cysteine desulfurase
VGWASVKQEIFETVDFWDIWSLRLSETASRFEVGTPSTVSFVGAAEAMKMLLDFGIEKLKGEFWSLQTTSSKRLRRWTKASNPRRTTTPLRNS